MSLHAGLTRGITYLLRDTLYVSVTDRAPLLSAVASTFDLRGPGFRMPERSGYASLAESDLPEPSAEVLTSSIERMYSCQYDADAAVEEEMNGVVFGGRGDPLLRLDVLQDVADQIHERRHGVPFRINTTGIVHAPSPAEQRAAEDRVLRGLLAAKIGAVNVLLPAATPNDYSAAMGLRDSYVDPSTGNTVSVDKVKVFQNVCGLIAKMAETEGVDVVCTAVEGLPVGGKFVSTNDVKALALGLGAVDFRTKAYVPAHTP